MNKFLLIASDIHSDEEAFSKLAELAQDKDCLAFLYAGDLDIENPLILMAINNRNFSFLPVLGNCDSPWEYSSYGLQVPPIYRTCSFNGLKINISHGHIAVPTEESNLIITGHTHIPSLTKEGNSVFLNPGSPARPRGYSKKSYATVEFSNSEAVITIKELDNNKKISSLTHLS